jgi:carbonic anhydrase
MQISRFCRLVIAAAGLVLAAACVGPPPPPPPPMNCCEVPWNYAEQADWATLSPCYFDCGWNREKPPGGEQSPIDFVNPRQQSLPAVDFSAWGKVPGLKSRNDGHTVRIDLPKGAASLKLDGMTYELLQFHFHQPSEHKIRGNARAMEIHFVNASEGGRVVAVGVFIKNGTSNAELAKIWKDLPKKKGDVVDVGEINLGALLPSGRSSFRYAGSLTNPPCNQGFQWIFYHDAIDLSADDVQKFAAIFPGPDGNSRRVQPLNGRVVLTDVPRP